MQLDVPQRSWQTPGLPVLADTVVSASAMSLLGHGTEELLSLLHVSLLW